MTGKSYSMKEMKMIVEYLVERKAFGEIKGRKMWMDFANSQVTLRTWQSLKETFLKRILPDIHNPYYKLTVDQIRSFREGCDTESKEKNKLEIVNLDEDSNSNLNAENQEDKEQPSTSHANNGDAKSGEDVTCSKVQNRDRDSVDTVIIPTCYETAEDVQRALESPNNEKDPQSNMSTPPSKSLRDLITYSEPLTPMLQEVLHDFASDSDSSEMRMQIVENPLDLEPQKEANNEETPTKIPDSEPNVNQESPIVIVDTEDMLANDEDQQNDDNTEDANDFVEPKVLSLKLRKRKGGYEVDKKKNAAKSKADDNISPEAVESTVPNKPSVSEKSTNENETKNEKQKEHCKNNNEKTTPEKCTSTQSTSADSILPNNQEAFNHSENNVIPNNEKQIENEIQNSKQAKQINSEGNKKGKSRKRAISQDVTSTTHIIKKPLISKSKLKEKAMSDTDTIKKNLKVKSTKSKADFVNKAKQDKNENTKSGNSGKKVETGTKNNVENTVTASQEKDDSMTDVSQLNPCLKSVSLFDEQFNKDSYVHSDSEHEGGKASAENKNKNASDKVNEVVVLKSHSESEEQKIATKKSKHELRVSKQDRNKILANVFGFSSGTIGPKRKKIINYRKTSHRGLRHESSGESSEWTSESDDSEASVSPPRGRKNRQTRKYLKPQSARILSLEEEGGLFVMYGKKIYPLVKDGKIIKNYLTYLPESDPEDEESYWKSKYVEEKQRVEELKKLVVENQQNNVRDPSPILMSKATCNVSIANEQRTLAKSAVSKHNEPEPTAVKERKEEVNDKGKTLKITFSKNNQEVHVEGHWSNIHPVLAEVVQIFNNDNKARDPLPNGNGGIAKQLSDVSSEKSVIPIIDEEVHEKVNRIEAEIFKEIERRDREEQEQTKQSSEEIELSGTNVTNRKRQLKTKRSSSSRSSNAQNSPANSRSPKRQKTTVTNEQKSLDTNEPKVSDSNEAVKTATPKNEEKTSPVEKRISRARQVKKVNKTVQTDKAGEESKKKPAGRQQKIENSNATPDTNKNKSNVTTRKHSKTPMKDEGTPKSNKATRSSKTSLSKSNSVEEDDDEVRYMFPPATKAAKTKSAVSVGNTKDKRYSEETPKIFYSPNLSLHSESTQGYHDSDISPPKATLRRKRKLSLSTALSKIRHRCYRNKRKSYPIITDDISSDSNSSFPIVTQPASETSLKSEAYRSDSYQLLFPQIRPVFRPLERIEEVDPTDKNRLGIEQNSSLLDAFKDAIKRNVNNDFVSSSNANTDGGNSSNISLPLSPELSIVENLSISKEMLKSADNQPTLNEIHASHIGNSEIRNKFTMSQVDVSMPLMQQSSSLRQSFYNVIKTENFDDASQLGFPESLLNQFNTVVMEDAPLSESLDTRLKNLLLDSAKKMSLGPNELEDNKEGSKEMLRKSKSGKRCSTPRKKKDVQKKKLKLIHPVVEEEFTETCSYGGRQSCPPSIRLITEDNVCKENVDANINEDIDDNKNSRGRRKKDVIKVKILRPKSKIRKEHTPKKKENNPIHDSGINDTESMISNQGVDDSIDLIHNHSETCLHTNECMANSLEFIETTSTSIISINSESMCTDTNTQIVFKDCQVLLADMYCQNAQDCANLDDVQLPSKVNDDCSGETVYHSPIPSDTSLITEDLSDECPPRQPTTWHLLSEDETQTAQASYSGFGSSLKQIFPITCAVPDLSTITEMSNENSRKPTLESDTSTRQDIF